MGGLGPGIGGSEWFIIGLVALLVVGPERLPGLLRQLGKMVAKARGMANEFRASFDEMARQSELDDLRKEVEALKSGQSTGLNPVALGAEANAAFKDIRSEFDKPLFADTPPTVVPEAVAEPTMTPAASEWPDGEPVMMPLAAPPVIAEEVLAPAPAPSAPLPAKARARKAVASPEVAPAKPRPAKAAVAKPRARPVAKTTTKTPATASPKTPRKPKPDQ